MNRVPQHLRRTPQNFRRPFWLPASNYYVLSTAIAAAVFFLVWGMLRETEEEAPWITAGFFANIVLICAVVLREIVLRRYRERLLINQKRLDHNLRNVPRRQVTAEQKISLERNSEFINEIERKSQAAKVLNKLPEAHLEAFEACYDYLQMTGKQLETINHGSPRLEAILKGRAKVESLGHSHLLQWASGESRYLVQEARNRANMTEKVEMAQRAVNVLESALRFYPEDEELIESLSVVKEFLVSIRVSHWMEQAERAAFKGNNQRAISHYRDALFFLAREGAANPEHETIAAKINTEIENLRQGIPGDESKGW